MKDCIEEIGSFMKNDEILSISDKILKILMESDKRKTENE